jgi:hypothetical protein
MITVGSIRPVGPDHLLDEGALGALHLPRAGRGADEGGLRAQRLPFLELQRPVVDRRGQAEAELGQHALAVEVAAEHAADLRHRDVALVADQQRVLGEVFEQRRRRLARLAAGEVARIVLDAGAGAGRLHHLDVEQRALLEPLRLEQAAGAVELVEPLLEVGLYLLDRLLHRRLGRHVVAVGVDDDVVERQGLVAVCENNSSRLSPFAYQLRRARYAVQKRFSNFPSEFEKVLLRIFHHTTHNTSLFFTADVTERW